MMKSVTCTAPVNIAVIKYWGKRDEKLILPINSSISATLGQNELRAKTTAAISKDFTEDKMWLNGEEQPMTSSRIQNVLKEIKRRAQKRKSQEMADDSIHWHLHVCSENNFPTAAGLASSAAGYACFVHTLAQLYGITGEISDIARLGSGSACRSVYGGFVLWDMGTEQNGSDSIAKQIAPESHWPELRILILVVSDQRKYVGSSEGMQTSVQTCELLKKRTEIVSSRIDQMTEAILKKDFETFAELTMKESNQLHAVCLDTFPPISYMRDVSHHIVRLVHNYNKIVGHTKVAYTFDAGPNACLYLLEEDVPAVMSLVNHFYPPVQNGTELTVKGLSIEKIPHQQNIVDAIQLPTQPGAVKYCIHTKVGPGPQVIKSPAESLLDSTGQPKTVST
ncbi:diphosphomevalonate decarboxylase-like [Gigantopelta aegis]|uniref:diphosphomevalonate decarboxylase-like n=1 Tax=Gigantopelta aegis TaxID=1735272 RepID=UPI001B88B74A|nr:diphosphomevalonate decarboxylase-like [Gigantopelta aegis]